MGGEKKKKKLEDSVVTLNIAHNTLNMSMSQQQPTRSARMLGTRREVDAAEVEIWR